jgi:indolepyruvate ferredoxin oxidoreductase
VNEELAATSVMGSQIVSSQPGARFDGVVGLWYGKAPGLDRAADAIRHANHAGVARAGGVVLLVGDDPSCKSSTLPSSSELALADLLVPFVSPADPQDVVDLGLHAIALSRASGLWAGMKIATAVADGCATVDVSPERVQPRLPATRFEHVVDARLLGPIVLAAEREIHEARMHVALEYIRANGLNAIERAGARDRVGLVAAGKTYLDLRQALLALGLDDAGLERAGVRLLKIAVPYPLEPTVVRDFARGLEAIVVVEDKRPFLELFVKDALYGGAGAPAVVGKRDERGELLLPAHGELTPDMIRRALAGYLTRTGYADVSAPAPAPLEPLPLARRPHFCSGCPHNRSTVVPDGSLVGAGIGCHTMVLLQSRPDTGSYAGLTQMGGEGAQWIGMAPFTDVPHMFQNIGDGTLFHSGTLAIRAAVASGAHITFKILQNGAVAMTGGQAPEGGLGTAELSALLLTEGVQRVIVTTEDLERLRSAALPAGVEVWHRDRLVEAQETLAGTPGVTALIHDQECAAEKRRKRKRGTAADPAERIFINHRVCEGCGDCGTQSNCLSLRPIDTEFGRKTTIHQGSCNQDDSCVDGDCPAFIRVVRHGRPRPTGGAPIDSGRLPEPVRADLAGFNLRIVGIGGTGVVTIAQVLAMAGLIDGWHVRGQDQTGLAQKGGPVVSDLRCTRAPALTGSRLGEGECDLYLACDVLAGADPANLACADPERTLAVVSSAAVPVGTVTGATEPAFPPVAGLVDRISVRTRADSAVVLDAQALTRARFGSDVGANVFLVGAAYQTGAIPLPAAAIEQALALNGVAVEQNIQAFRAGRLTVAEPAGNGAAPVAAGDELQRLLDIRMRELTAYQSRSYAREYAAFVTSVAERERAVIPGATAVTEAVARNLYKLMAYKDEYEVARLHLDPEIRAAVEAEFGSGARMTWLLHPPLLRALGRRRKIAVGPWFSVPFRLLRALRRLRGTPFDVFGRAEVRRVERALPGEYRRLVDRALAHLTAQTRGEVLAIAELPDGIRGYEQIKLRNVEWFKMEAETRMTGLASS